MPNVTSIAAEERNDINPVCPHCSEKIQTIFMKSIQGFLGKRYIYFCPSCHKVLGISHRKGFWMG